jgi:hypothetical protein
MTCLSEYSAGRPANDNPDPFRSPESALVHVCKARRQLIEKDKTGYSAQQWQVHVKAMVRADEIIAFLTAYLEQLKRQQ